jgi:alkylation response protein AidB-like acyl-CoA dehydrogenase
VTVGLLPAPTEEQAMLLDTSVRFIEAEVPLAAVRERADGADGARGSDPRYRRGAAALGWFGMLATEAHGGGSASGNGVADAAMIAAERGARLQPGPFVGHNVVVFALATAATAATTGPDTHDDVLTGLVEGRHWATWAPDAPWTGAGAAGLVLRPSEGGYTLDGTVGPVADAEDCAWVLVTASGDDGPVQALVPADGPGVTRRRLDGLDVTRRWCAIAFDGCPVPADALVGVPGPSTGALVGAQLDVAAVLSVAEAVGALHANVALAVDYAKERIAFGRPIGSFQAVKHLLADTSLWLEMAKGIVATAADALGRGRPDGPALADVAKSFVGERSAEATHNCFQVFGGIGYTWEHDQHLFMRRLAADAAVFGSPAWHRRRLLEREGL